MLVMVNYQIVSKKVQNCLALGSFVILLSVCSAFAAMEAGIDGQQTIYGSFFPIIGLF